MLNRLKFYINSIVIFKIINEVYTVLLGVYLLFIMSRTSTFFLPFPVKFEKYLLLLLFVCSIGRCLFAVIGMTLQDSIWKRYIAFFGAFWVATVYLFVYYSDEFVFLLYLGVLTVGCIGIDYQKLLRLHVGLLSVFLRFRWGYRELCVHEGWLYS